MARSRSIRRKLGFGMILALAVGIVVLGAFYVSSIVVVRSIVSEDTSQTAMLVGEMLEREIATTKAWARDVARVEILERSLARNSREPAQSFLRERLNARSFTAFWLLDAKGRVLARALSGDVPLEPPGMPAGREVAFPVIDGRLAMAVAAPVGHGEDSNRGLLVCLSNFPDQSVFKGMESRGLFGLALWADGRLVASSPWLMATNYPLVRPDDSGDFIHLETRDGGGTFLAVPLPAANMAELGGIRAELVRDMRRAQRPFFWLVLLFVAAWGFMAAIFLAFGRYISTRLVDPVLALSREAERIRKIKSRDVNDARGPLDAGESEIDQLYRSFTLMVQGLDQALERASRAEDKYRGIFVNALEGLFQTTPEGRFIAVNPAMAEIAGYESSEHMLKEVRDVGRQHYMDQADRTRMFNAIQAMGMVEGYEMRMRRVDGRPIWASVSVRAVRDDDGRVVMYEGSMVDVTEAKRSAEALKEAKERAEAALSELEAFSYSVSHDLRTPLRAVDGFSQALFEDYGHKLGQEGRDHLLRVRKAVQRIGELIDDLQNLVKVMRLDVKPETVDVTAMAQGILGGMAAADPKRRVNVQVEPGMVARADPGLLDLALRHLLHNAWKFTSRRQDPFIAVGVSEEGEERVFHVKDNGAGFDMAFAHKLFGPFGRLHSPQEYEGSGIGLAIVKRAVTRHRGRIWADAAPGKGASFYFTLD